MITEITLLIYWLQMPLVRWSHQIQTTAAQSSRRLHFLCKSFRYLFSRSIIQIIIIHYVKPRISVVITSCIRCLLWPCVRLSVRLSRAGIVTKRLNGSSSSSASVDLSYTLCYREIWKSPKISVHLSETLSQTPDLVDIYSIGLWQSLSMHWLRGQKGKG